MFDLVILCRYFLTVSKTAFGFGEEDQNVGGLMTILSILCKEEKDSKELLMKFKTLLLILISPVKRKQTLI